MVVALREERAAAERAVGALGADAAARIRVLQGGLGGAAAAAAAQRLLGAAPRIRLIVSCGFSGGLAETLSVGDLFLADRVRARPSLDRAAQGDDVLPVSSAAAERAAQAFSKAGLAFRRGTLVTVAQPVLRSEDKRVLGQATSAEAVDMEAAAVARIAREAGIAFAALRAISDGVDDALPPEVSSFLDGRGRLRTGQVLRFAAGGPANLKRLWQLKSRSDRAAATLETALRIAIPAWLEGDA